MKGYTIFTDEHRPVCPHCKAAIGMAESMSDIVTPEPGTLSICTGCVGVGMFDVGEDGMMGVRRLTLEEQQSVDEDEHVQEVLEELRAGRRP